MRGGKAGAWKACPGQFYEVGGLAAGRYVFQVEGNDEGRVDRTPASRAFTVSAQGPQVFLTSHPGASLAGTAASFTYASSVPNAQFECRLVAWGGTAPLAPCDPSGMTFDGLPDGSYRFEVVARDLATGEASDPGAGWFFRIDNTGPTIVFSTEPAAITARDDVAFRFAADEATVGDFGCTLDQKPVACADGSLHVDRARAGGHNLQVSAMDTAGNIATTSYRWLVDRGAPKVLIVTGPSRTTDQTTAAFDLWSSANPGMFTCQLDDLPLMPCFTAPVLTGLADGKHQLVVWSYDVAGNRSEAASYVWTVRAA